MSQPVPRAVPIPGEKGRPAGSTNRRTTAMLDLIEAAYPGDDPVLWMWHKTHDPEIAMELRVSCAKEVAQYVHAKRRATEVTGANGAPLELVVHNDVKAADALQALIVTLDNANPS